MRSLFVLKPLKPLKPLHRLRPGPRTSRTAAVLALLWLLVTGVQHLRGWPGWTLELPVASSAIRPEPKKKGVWKAPVPSRHRSWLTDHRGILREDGHSVGRRSASISAVLKEAGGMFVISNAFVRWRSADGSDPRKSGKKLVLEVPVPLPFWTWTAGLGLLAWAWTGPVRRSRPPQAMWREGNSGPESMSAPEGGAERESGSGLPAGAASAFPAPEPSPQPGGGIETPAPPPRNRQAWWRGAAGALLVMLAAGALAFSRVPRAEHTNDGVMMIKGLPYSDAACWYEMSVSLAEGRGLASGFDGQRPWYSVMMAMLHAGRGRLAVEHGLIVNALSLSLAAGMIFLTGRLLGSGMIGLGAAAVLLLSHQNGVNAAALLTETSGLAFTALSLALVLMAITLPRSPGRPRRLWFAGLALGGVFQGLGNLTCPYTLAAVPLYGLLLLAEGRRTTAAPPSAIFLEPARRDRALNLRRLLKPGLIFAAGFALVLGPWVVRQHRVHGLATLSTQTADLLYGGTFEEGPMKPRQMRELHDHLDQTGYTVEAKYRFSMRRYLETVAEDPLRYAGRLGDGALAFFGYFNVTSPEPAAAAVLVALAAVWRQRRHPVRLAWLVAGAGMAALAVYVVRLPSRHGDPGPLLALAAGSTVLAWMTAPRPARMGVLWVTATLSGCVLINALTGNVIASRCWVFCAWCLWLLVLAAVYGTTLRLGALLARGMRTPGRRHPAWRTPGLAGEVPARGFSLRQAWHSGMPSVSGLAGARGFILAAGLTVLAVQAGGSALLLARQRQPVVFPPEPLPEDLARAREWAGHLYALKEQHSGHPLQYLWARAGEGACFLATGEEATRFSRAFARKPRPRTLRLMRGVPATRGQAAPGWMVRIPGDARAPAMMPPERPGLLVAWLSIDKKANLGHDEEIYEALAFLPGDDAGRIDPSRAILYHIPPVPAAPVPAPVPLSTLLSLQEDPGADSFPDAAGEEAACSAGPGPAPDSAAGEAAPSGGPLPPSIPE